MYRAGVDSQSPEDSVTWQWQGGDFFFFKVLVTIFCLFIFDCAGSSVLLGLLSRCSERGLSLVVVCRLVAEHGLWGVRASVVVALRL